MLLRQCGQGTICSQFSLLSVLALAWAWHYRPAALPEGRNSELLVGRVHNKGGEILMFPRTG
eukprot:7499414-Pyramimonas_sp.AAC.1